MDRRQAADLLGVEPGADHASVDRAFRRRAQELHPDHGGDAEALRRAIEARAVLLGTRPTAGRAPRRSEPVGLRVMPMPWWWRLAREVRLLLPSRWRRRLRDLR